MDDQLKHDLSWVVIWLTLTLLFALIGWVGRSAWWIGALITGSFLYFYAVAGFGAWRDRIAQSERDDEDD
jgi:hypothetical protein